jgi:GMP synthase (glutamine-hydrolysing)
VGTLGIHQGAVVDRAFGEPVGAVRVTLTNEGKADPVFGALPETFEAFVGHKEAVSKLPGHAVHLAGSESCPVQAFRFGDNVYATQFHPELDVEGICFRIDVYKHHGYFEPHRAEEIKAMARSSDVRHPETVLRAFAARYR